MQCAPSGSTERTMPSSASFLLRSSSVSSSWALSKWSSIARLLRPVTNIIWVIPAAAASSTAYWISGLSTIGSISFGLAFVTGRKRLPSPATGNTALVTLANAIDQVLELSRIQHRDAELVGAVELASCVGACDHVRRLL